MNFLEFIATTEPIPLHVPSPDQPPKLAAGILLGVYFPLVITQNPYKIDYREIRLSLQKRDSRWVDPKPNPIRTLGIPPKINSKTISLKKRSSESHGVL